MVNSAARAGAQIAWSLGTWPRKTLDLRSPAKVLFDDCLKHVIDIQLIVELGL